MAIDKDSAVENARKTWPGAENQRRRRQTKVSRRFRLPDMALGAAEDGEMSGQMITAAGASSSSAGTNLRIPR
jgi:hypothetical protein